VKERKDRRKRNKLLTEYIYIYIYMEVPEIYVGSETNQETLAMPVSTVYSCSLGGKQQIEVYNNDGRIK
jgi:hypothetical protein